MTVQAQNALLKTIEEPPAYAVILLLTTNPDGFLPTILSRCVQLKLKPLPDSMIRGYLTEKMGVSESQSEYKETLFSACLDIKYFEKYPPDGHFPAFGRYQAPEG